MPTKLSRFYDALIEACWLAALVVVPLFFNIYSSRIFEPDKIAILRSLALVILAAWVLKLVEVGGLRWERFRLGRGLGDTLLRTPLLAPVLALAAVYLVATVFSITPRVSFLGSYQRLQGTYTTLAYLVLFAAVVGNLRRPAQIERLITTAILTSLPISLYGILQRYQLDPIPWGGDVIERIAGNMGNSIFLGAYLIMVSPFTLVRIIEAFRAILKERSGLGVHVARATVYIFIGAVQLIALYFTGSRGPWLGWMAGVFFLFILLTLHWRRRDLMLGVMAAGLVGGVFLIVLNLPGGPLEPLRQNPNLARLGHLFNSESDTGRVRTLIWGGAAQLVAPHAPLTYPDGAPDRLNALRPLIGYGPESMYVAFNPFYPPELGQLEKRNASPDRSHNETWDTLVITGVLGLLVYLVLFAFIFYYGLRWLGLIVSARQRWAFFGAYALGGVTAATVLALTRGVAFMGVGIPAGSIAGAVIYLVASALRTPPSGAVAEVDSARTLVIAGVMAVVTAHFVETNFGIAIVASRLYFWVWVGLLVVVGYVLPRLEGRAATAAATVAPSSGVEAAASRKKRRPEKRVFSDARAATWNVGLQEGLAAGLVGALLLATLFYNYVGSIGADSAGATFFGSLVRVRDGRGAAYGVLALILSTWLATALLWAADASQRDPRARFGTVFGLGLGVSAALGLLFGLIHAAALYNLGAYQATTLTEMLTQVGGYESLLGRFYGYLFVLVLGLGVSLTLDWPRPTASGVGWIVGPLLAAVLLALVATSNLRVIQADVAFKMAEPFAKPEQWPVAIQIYRRAIALAPQEDFYYLFLGRGYIEHAKSLTDPAERDRLIAQAEADLLKAQRINPLNPDHTANLARLNSQWASYQTDPARRAELGATSDAYFAAATRLSPRNTRLWDEWAILQLEVLDDPAAAQSLLATSAALDPTYDWTHFVAAQGYIRQVGATDDPAQKADLLRQAAAAYETGLTLPDTVGAAARQSYYLALGSIYVQTGQPEAAIRAYEAGLALGSSDSNVWRVEETLAQLYQQLGDLAAAAQHAQAALRAAPTDQQARLQTYLAQLQGP
jgi:tetratricopeptide (TPR) repeat protein/O-antigen ligase